MTSPDTALADRREAVVRAHMQHENDLDFDATLATFERVSFDASTMLAQLGLT